jgi:Family of unknown function (DUF6544)
MNATLGTLRESTPSAQRCVFEPQQIANLPAAARKYLEHAIAPGIPFASAVRVRMRGEIKLKRWLPVRIRR